jgi:hypothetical protein
MARWKPARDHKSLIHKYAKISRQQVISPSILKLFRCFCSLAVSIWDRARRRVLSMSSSEGCSTPVSRSHWAYRSRFSGLIVVLFFTVPPILTVHGHVKLVSETNHIDITIARFVRFRFPGSLLDKGRFAPPPPGLTNGSRQVLAHTCVKPIEGRTFFPSP